MRSKSKPGTSSLALRWKVDFFRRAEQGVFAARNQQQINPPRIQKLNNPRYEIRTSHDDPSLTPRVEIVSCARHFAICNLQ